MIRSDNRKNKQEFKNLEFQNLENKSFKQLDINMKRKEI
jgi:hypothetical protein